MHLSATLTKVRNRYLIASRVLSFPYFIALEKLWFALWRNVYKSFVSDLKFDDCILLLGKIWATQSTQKFVRGVIERLKKHLSPNMFSWKVFVRKWEWVTPKRTPQHTNSSSHFTPKISSRKSISRAASGMLFRKLQKIITSRASSR
jgi:hypothetical protein